MSKKYSNQELLSFVERQIDFREKRYYFLSRLFFTIFCLYFILFFICVSSNLHLSDADPKKLVGVDIYLVPLFVSLFIGVPLTFGFYGAKYHPYE